ncbi:nitric oxide reductase activation protein NorD [Thiomicrospira sp.]|uniref:nitric oxide reductase activation protein NorD n=1 Tax=Thiomicrospira sp. TaxID=935 RepID=UPI002F9403E3
MTLELLETYRKQLNCGFEQVQQLFPQCVAQARECLSEAGLNTYLEKAQLLCKMGRGAEPSIIYLDEMPSIASHLGEASLSAVADYAYKLARSPNSKAIVPFLQSLASLNRRIDQVEQLNEYLAMLDDFIDRTQTVIHGHQSMYESKGLIPMLDKVPFLVGKLTLDGLRRWMDYGIRNYQHFPDQQAEYFALQSADSKNIMQRERHGVVFKDVERQLDMLQSALWNQERMFVSFSTAFDQIKKPIPYIEEDAMRVPDMYDDLNGVSGLDRYRAMLMHMMAHYTWSKPTIGDNMAPQVQLFLELFEDCRVDSLAVARFPGLRKLFLALHPVPLEGSCDDSQESCLRYRSTRLSRALLDPNFKPNDALIENMVEQFNQVMQKGENSSIEDLRDLATHYFVKSRKQTDSLPNLYFTDTEISYRDDNRYLWVFHEEGDEADDTVENEYQPDDQDREIDQDGGLPPRHYDEWDYISETYRPEWTTVYERLHPAGDANKIDSLLAKHAGLVKQLKRVIEMLKPQNKVRVRFQEEGDELDLDVAIRSLIDYKSGSQPDPRINTSHTPAGRSISVMLLVDMSESLNQRVAGTDQTLLELSQEALALLAWAVEQLGDPFAIAGFSSDTRHEVRYQHIKGYSEHWSEPVKSRIAAMEAGYSTRMGAAMRHAAHYLSAQQTDKKLMLILTDGEPADIDVKDPKMLIQDTKQAVTELANQGIYTYCINMDPKADEYVADIFGNHYAIIDKVERLPEQLPKLFINLTQ